MDIATMQPAQSGKGKAKPAAKGTAGAALGVLIVTIHRCLHAPTLKSSKRNPARTRCAGWKS
jgi:hypothetical protein